MEKMEAESLADLVRIAELINYPSLKSNLYRTKVQLYHFSLTLKLLCND